MTPLPALRVDIEITPSRQDGRSIFLVRDHGGISPDGMALSILGFAVASLLDGRRTSADIRREFKALTGTELGEAELANMVRELDSLDLLETPSVAAKRKKIWGGFEKAAVREAVHAGASYSAEPAELAAALDRFFVSPDGPGTPERRLKAAPPIGILAPHIDFTRGGPAYAWAYRELAASDPPDRIVALGVAHVSPKNPWTFTKKAYATPLGSMDLDPELFEEMAAAAGTGALEDEWSHRLEHSLEFQAVWLKHVWGKRAPKWVPILCSTFERYGAAPSQSKEVEPVLEKWGRLLADRAKKGERILVLGGVDLAHVGLCFGDPAAPDEAMKKKIELEDALSMERALKLDSDGFYRSVVAGDHWRKVCGLSAIYSALKLVRSIGGEKTSGKLLRYGQAPDPRGGVVSFVSAVFR